MEGGPKMNWHFHIRSLGQPAPSSFVKSANAVKLNARFPDIGGKALGLEFETKADNVEILVATKNFGMLQTHSSDRVINQEFSPITAGGGKKVFTVR